MFSFSRLPSWQEDLTVAIRGRLCRLCVRALFKMALSVAAQWYHSGQERSRSSLSWITPKCWSEVIKIASTTTIITITTTGKKVLANNVLSTEMWRLSANRWVPSLSWSRDLIVLSRGI